MNTDTGAVHLGQGFFDIDHVDIMTREVIVNFDFLLGSIHWYVNWLAHTGATLGTQTIHAEVRRGRLWTFCLGYTLLVQVDERFFSLRCFDWDFFNDVVTEFQSIKRKLWLPLLHLLFTLFCR